MSDDELRAEVEKVARVDKHFSFKEGGHLNMGLFTQKRINATQFEVSDHYGLGLAKLRKIRKEGNGPKFIKVSGQIGKRGGRILYPVREFEAWLNSLQAPAGSTVK